MPARTWIKLYCESWLKGTLRQESRQFRGDWADLLALAGGLTYGEDGVIKLADGVGLSDDQIAKMLNITQSEWLTTKARAIATERIKVDGNNVITITNFGKYQSEYSRQKPYRENAKRKKWNKQFEALDPELKQRCIDHYGDPETWDNMTWIVVTGKLPDCEWERIRAEEKASKAQ